MSEIRAGDWRSPHPSEAEVERGQAQRNEPPRELPGIDLNVAEQLRLAWSLPDFEPGPRYHPDADYFARCDAYALHGILNALRPRSVVEVGSGYSSAVMLDVGVPVLCIDPEPERLLSLMQPGDVPQILNQPVQDVPLEVFESLGRGDVLFVDSSHIAKMGSDVNHIFFEILPRLHSGVWVHFHDIFWPFEYPREWIEYGWLRNEAYVLRALLTHTNEWSIRLFSSYLSVFHSQEIPADLIHGGSIWLERR